MNKNILIGAGAIVIVIILLYNLAPKDQESQPVDVEVEVVSQTQQAVDTSAQELYEEALLLKNEGEVVKVKEIYSNIISQYPDFENVERIQKELEDLNMRIIFSNIQTEDTVMHEVVKGDTLGGLAKKYGTTIQLIKINNNLKNDIIRLDQRLRIWTGGFNIFVDKSQNILILKKDEEIIKVYDVSTGANNSTPVGEFKVTTKLIDPVWFNRGVVVPPESPENVLGTRWLGFDIPGYGIHGTVVPQDIGKQVTAGCVRMRNEDVEELYSIITYKTKVVIVD